MRIQVERDGGFAYFPGLSGPTTVDTAALPADEAAALEVEVRQVVFGAEGAKGAAPPAGAADLRMVTISVEAEGCSRSITVPEPIEDDALRSLVERVRAAAGLV